MRFGLVLLLGAVLIGTASAGALAQEPKVYLSVEEIEEIKRGTACRSLVRQFFALQKRMGSGGIETDAYDLKILPSTELVETRPGKYYVIYLKDTTKRARFEFPAGRYVIDDFETRFRNALSVFARDVLAVIEGGASYEIYTRGSSSATPMTVKRTLVKGREYREIEFLRKLGNDRYAADNPGVRTCPTEYTNEDLPYLRAAFLKSVVNQFFPLKQPVVLQSDVAAEKDAAQQFAELILYVDW